MLIGRCDVSPDRFVGRTGEFEASFIIGVIPSVSTIPRSSLINKKGSVGHPLDFSAYFVIFLSYGGNRSPYYQYN